MWHPCSVGTPVCFDFRQRLCAPMTCMMCVHLSAIHPPTLLAICRPPLLGFKYMQPPIAINMRGHVGTASDESALPTASTCFNLLKLPPYQDEQTMLQKLLLAIEGAQTFDLS